VFQQNDTHVYNALIIVIHFTKNVRSIIFVLILVHKLSNLDTYIYRLSFRVRDFKKIDSTNLKN